MTRSNTLQPDRYLVVASDNDQIPPKAYAELMEAREAAQAIAAETGNRVRVYQFNSSVELKLMPQWQEAKRGD
jgi:predicted alpha/beta hydrolase family esterase